MIQLVLFIFQCALGLEPDLSLSVSMRTRPIGAQLRAEGGYGYLLWGQKQPNQPPLYG